MDDVEDRIRRAAEQDERSTTPKNSTDVDAVYAGDDYQKSLDQHQIEALQQQLNESRSTQSLREKYLPRIFCLICFWLILITIFLVVCGWRLWKFYLPDNVMIALITSTTIGVLGLFGIAAKWLFPNKHDN